MADQVKQSMVDYTGIGTADTTVCRPPDETITLTVYFTKGEGGAANLKREDAQQGVLCAQDGTELHNSFPLEEGIALFRKMVQGERSPSNKDSGKRKAGQYGGNVGA